jgi:hypothetical protein
VTPPLTARVNKQQLERISRLVASQPERVARGAKRMFGQWGQEWFGRMQNRFGETKQLTARTGRLRRSLNHVVTGSSVSDLKLSITSAGVSYARVQEFGGVIRPKNGRFLAIPTEANKTSAGVAKYPTPRALIEAKPGQTFFMRNKQNANRLTLFLVGTKGARAKTERFKGAIGAQRETFVPMFILVPQVEIPGPKAPNKTRSSRLGFFDTWRALGPSRTVSLARLGEQIVKGVA